jgi:hypothetical protein
VAFLRLRKYCGFLHQLGLSLDFILLFPPDDSSNQPPSTYVSIVSGNSTTSTFSDANIRNQNCLYSSFLLSVIALGIIIKYP